MAVINFSDTSKFWNSIRWISIEKDTWKFSSVVDLYKTPLLLSKLVHFCLQIDSKETEIEHSMIKKPINFYYG